MDVALEDIDLSSFELWQAPEDVREATFRTLRREAPVRFFAEAEYQPFPAGPGYWALTRYDDVWAVSRKPQLFCSGRGTNIPDLPIEIAEFFGSMINMDDPGTPGSAAIVQAGFTPKMVSQDRGVRAPQGRRRSSTAARALSGGRVRLRERDRGAAAARRSSAR